MKSSKNQLILVLLIALTIALVAYWRKKPADDHRVDVEQFPLKRGSTGKHVRQLQQYLLNRFGLEAMPQGVTGLYDGQTERAVIELMHREKGVVNLKTFQEFGIYKY